MHVDLVVSRQQDNEHSDVSEAGVVSLHTERASERERLSVHEDFHCESVSLGAAGPFEAEDPECFFLPVDLNVHKGVRGLWHAEPTLKSGCARVSIQQQRSVVVQLHALFD